MRTFLVGLLVAAGVLVGAAPAQAATETCEQYGTVTVEGGRYIVQNNRWGASTAQCISVDGAGFRVTRADHNNATNGPPASYPSIYAGCHYGNCTSGSGLPVRVRDFGDPRATFNISTPDSGEWDAAFDLWFDASANPPGQNYGAELMIWTNHRGRPQPIGSRVGSVNLEGGTWDVWIGNIGWNVISYVRTTPANTMNNFSVKAFTNDAVGRGQINPAWFMTSVQAGFEPWIGGAGLAVNQFAFNLNGGTSSGSSVIRGAGSNRCLDLAGWGTADGNDIILWDCHGGWNQQWRRNGNALVNPQSGKCLDVQAAGTANGSAVWLWSCIPNGPAQQWVQQSNGTLRNPNSGKCLDADGWGTANGTQLIIWDCGAAQSNQIWRFA
ncbi:RICIN domain-containing protein [Actinoplanes bogorensis]|uniref:RICIN domain-containing protein n=1 Tax=Paractinoplanes bogorensis TaxID=1610840 RepID=A0ABS5Z2N9_9ACTN|nr:RICIN domain-containing protein [Actinoplanes bogorensis]MBU2669606.1 RICIN domain-containing protein [Actinoplanes bogorensis]